METNLQKLIVGLNNVVKLRYEDGSEFLVRILEQKPEQTPQTTKEFSVDKDAPVAKAILGHQVGESVRFKVNNGDENLVEILEIV